MYGYIISLCTFLFYYILIGCKIQSLFCLYHWQSAVLSMYFPVNGRVRSIRVCGEDGNVIDNEITARRYPGRAVVELSEASVNQRAAPWGDIR